MPEYFVHPLIKKDTIERREYQEAILKTCLAGDTLCVLPTGTGKTAIAIMLAAHRLALFPQSSIVVLAPTRPLAEQHKKSFEACLNIVEPVALLTGKIPPQKREKMYKEARVIVATPQTIKNDIERFIFDLSDISLIVVDECHRSVKKYAYPFIIKKYFEIAKNPRVLGMTASPGSDIERINEVKANLHAEFVEIRTEQDKDVANYIKPVSIEWIKVDLDGELAMIQRLLKDVLMTHINRLKAFNIYVHSKKDLLLAQQKLQRSLAEGKKISLFYIISFVSETLKVWHAIELLETQSISALKSYIEKLREDKSKGAQRLIKDEKFKKAMDLIWGYNDEHPKIKKLAEMLAEIYKNNQSVKVILFSHYRDNIAMLYEIAKNINGCMPVMLVGQSSGTSKINGQNQKQQINNIRDFDAGTFNCLITSPVGEEGLHIPSVDIAIFYEPIASEIRTIQRKGRVGRVKTGKIIFLITRKTRDEANYWVSKRKEESMKRILKGMKKEKNLTSFLGSEHL